MKRGERGRKKKGKTACFLFFCADCVHQMLIRRNSLLQTHPIRPWRGEERKRGRGGKEKEKENELFE